MMMHRRVTRGNTVVTLIMLLIYGLLFWAVWPSGSPSTPEPVYTSGDERHAP